MQRWAMLAILAMALSGCSGSGGGKGATGTDGPGTAVDEDGNPVSAMVTLTNGLAAPLHRTIWANGTVAFQDTCNTGACVLGTDRAFHVTQVEVPRDIPVRLGVELDYNPNQGGVGGGFQAWVQADGTFFRYAYDGQPGSIRIDTTLLPTSNAEVYMAAFGPGGDMPETEYTLRIQVDADPQIVPPAVPVAVELGPGDNLTVGSDSTSAFALYGPDDTYHGRYEKGLQLPADAMEGEYVVLIAPGSPAGTIATDSGTRNMTTMGLRFVGGEQGTLPPNGAYDADFEVTGYPLAVGVSAGVTPGATGFYSFASTGLSMSLSGPNGVSLDSGVMCQICFTFGGFGAGMSTEPGDPAVVAGTYHVHAETQATYEAYILPYSIYFQRLG